MIGVTVSGNSTGGTVLLIDVSATTGAEGGANATSEAAGAAAGACPDLLVREDEPSLPPHPARTAIPASARHCICNRKFIRIINPRLTISALKKVR
ncbi:protein of unknown function [Paraburkholderia dioscoreae]|uniref:Uncharacterized protein n=1 Tax=Paraburkholderia dioscoreae TaxID=2604047 RepID=A0A5Q4ZU78_9BURK|nr:protein of unknown function [Paraburkholderia dioscoreae]